MKKQKTSGNRRYILAAFALVFIFIFTTTGIAMKRSEDLWSHMYKIWNYDEWSQINELQISFLKMLNDTRENEGKVKTIIYWNAFFSIKHFGYGIGRAPFADCEVSNCVVWDREDGPPPMPVQDFDALLFHACLEDAVAKIPPHRSSHQRYIFFLYESPGRFNFNFSSFTNFFNWTMTYRRDSDIYLPYGIISNVSIPSKTPITWLEPHFGNVSIKSNKTKPIAWIVSDCRTQSQRQAYVNELSQFIQVDVYGACGSFSCSRERGGEECLKMLEDNYLFYLSFENSLCQDYVTEKLFTYMSYSIVPIVYGGADYKTHAPPMSYIDVKDYSTPRKLAKYLDFLIKNPAEYEKYFWWKSYYRSYSTIGNFAMCSLCAMLHDAELPESVYSDITSWWSAPNVCHTVSQHFGN